MKNIDQLKKYEKDNNIKVLYEIHIENNNDDSERHISFGYVDDLINYLEKNEILTNVEKEYLKNVLSLYLKNYFIIIKRERDCNYITKRYDYYLNVQLISKYNNLYYDHLRLSCLEQEISYKNMELNKEYTLDELGL